MKNDLHSALNCDEIFEADSQRKTQGHSNFLESCESNCLHLRKCFFSARVVDRWNRLDQENLLSEKL